MGKIAGVRPANMSRRECSDGRAADRKDGGLRYGVRACPLLTKKS